MRILINSFYYRSNRSSSDVPIGDDFRLVDAGDRETEVSRDLLASISLVSDSTRQQTCQRPPGLGGRLKKQWTVCAWRYSVFQTKVMSRQCQSHQWSVAYALKVSARETSLYLCPVGIGFIFAVWIPGSALVETVPIVVDV